MIGRRQVVIGLGGVGLAGLVSLPIAARSTKSKGFNAGLARDIADIERANGGRLGVSVLDSATGARFSARGAERFPMCSTFKFLLAAAVLARVDRGEETLGRHVPITAADIAAYSPVTEKYVGVGLSVGALCEATMTLSDNGAANVLLPSIGGPAGFTRHVRSLGDRVTRLDRIEPFLNESLPDDPRDTTSPDAMLRLMERLLLGNALSVASRTQLLAWLAANKTGGKRIKAGLPADWSIGDKTGTGERGSTNDIAILWLPGRAPLLLTVYLTGGTASADANNAVHADAARAVVKALGG